MGEGAKKILIAATGVAIGVVVGQLIYNDVFKRWIIKG